MGYTGVGSVLLRFGVLRSEPDQTNIDSITLFVALLCACILIGHLLEKNRWMNESITALGIGLVSGIVILFYTDGRSSRVLVFNEDLFFTYVLPAIIFNAGFQVKKKQFFRNFMTINLFGAVGTLISFIIITLGSEKLFKTLDIGFLDTMDYLALGAVFSATDSVCTLQVLNQEETPFLYSLVFGEGVVNDATSVVLFNAIQRFDLSHINSSIAIHLLGSFLYLFTTSTFLGVAVGLLSAYTIKKLYLGRNSTDREVALMILMAYLSYIMAELLNLSGILTVFFCGIVMSHYTWHNVTERSRVTTKHAFATLSFISEIFVFLYVGMDALDMEKWNFVMKSPGTSIGVTLILLMLIVIGRAASIFLLSFLSNLTKESQSEKISLRQQVVIWWAGLMRGAVSMALAYNKFTSSGHTQRRENAIMITSTISVVLSSTVVFGLLTKPLIRWLMPREPPALAHDSSGVKSIALPLLANEQGSEPDINGSDLRRPTSLRMLLTTPTHTVHFYWRKFDDAFMRPVFGGSGFTRYVTDPDSSSTETILQR